MVIEVIRTVVAAALVAAIVGACGLQRGPFFASPLRYCGGDSDCPAHQHCGPQCFEDPTDGHCHIACMDGDSEIDMLRKKDAAP